MAYTYDYTKATAGNESATRRYLRFVKMTLTRCVRTKTFVFDGRPYDYLYHLYNKTWKNERGVEIPIFREILLRHQGKRILEVGNVLAHYFPIHHDVVDKYEVAPGVINQDIVEFAPSRKYDLIVSISTLEHVGWDEQPQTPAKLLQAIDHLRNTCLAPLGTLVASLPIGHNGYFDALLESGKTPFTTQHFLKRVFQEEYMGRNGLGKLSQRDLRTVCRQRPRDRRDPCVTGFPAYSCLVTRRWYLARSKDFQPSTRCASRTTSNAIS